MSRVFIFVFLVKASKKTDVERPQTSTGIIYILLFAVKNLMGFSQPFCNVYLHARPSRT